MHNSKISQIWQFLLQPTHPQKSTTNIIFYSFILGTALLLGSLVTCLVVSAIFWPFFWMFRGRFKVYIPRAIWTVGATFAAFFLVEAILGLVLGGPAAFKETVENIPFLAVLPIWVVTVAVPRDLLKALSLVASVVTIVAIILASLHTFILVSQSGFWFLSVYRPELMTGNSNVMALVAAVSLAAILNSFSISDSKIYSNLLLSGGLAAIVLILVSGSRVMWLSTLIVPFVYYIIVRPKLALPGKQVTITLIILTCVLSVPAVNLVSQRIHLTINEIEEVSEGSTDSSLNQRIILWKIAYAIFRESPLVGVGPGNAKQTMIEKSRELTGESIGFSHFHNMFATAVVRGGLLEIAALLAMFFVPLVAAIKGVKINQPDSKNYLAFLISLQIIFLLSGLTGLAIGHDIHDTLFVVGTVFALYGIFTSDKLLIDSPHKNR